MSSLLKDKRIFDRFLAGLPVKVHNRLENTQGEDFLKDISAGGAKIISSLPAKVNGEIEVFVEIPDGFSPMPLHGQVVWAKSINPDIWNLGMKFSKIDLLGMNRLMRFCRHENSIEQ